MERKTWRDVHVCVAVALPQGAGDAPKVAEPAFHEQGEGVYGTTESVLLLRRNAMKTRTEEGGCGDARDEERLLARLSTDVRDILPDRTQVSLSCESL